MIDDVYNARILDFAGNIPRIGLLEDEIESLKAEKASKTSSRSAAESFFKSK